MATVADVLKTLTDFAPFDAKMDFDNVGHLVGSTTTRVTELLVALDITSEVIDEAIELGAELIVSHHPIMFSAKTVTNSTVVGRKLMKLVSNNISAICMHTNLDAAAGGVNDALAEALGLRNVDLIEPAPAYGRVGTLASPMPMREFLEHVKTRLNGRGLRYHNSGRAVSRVAVVGGSGGSYLERALELGFDTLVTGEAKYDVFLDARELGMNLIDADHFCTENVVVPKLHALLSKAHGDVMCEISKTHGQTARFYV